MHPLRRHLLLLVPLRWVVRKHFSSSHSCPAAYQTTMTPWNLSNILEAPLEGLRRMASEPAARYGGHGNGEGGADRVRLPFHKRQATIREDRESYDAGIIDFHCNYEQNCTSLFKKIEKQEWSLVDKFLASGIWPDTNTIDAHSPEEQARTWVSRFDSSDSGHCRWSLLPVHLASILGAPYTTITHLVELYPEPASADGLNAIIPHLEKRNSGGSNRVIDSLLSASLDIFSPKAHITTPLPTRTENEPQHVRSLRMQIEEKTKTLSQDMDARAKLEVMCKVCDLRVVIKQEELKKMMESLNDLEIRSLEPLPSPETEEKSINDDLAAVPSFATSIKSTSPDYCLQFVDSFDALAPPARHIGEDGKNNKWGKHNKRAMKIHKNLEDQGKYIAADADVKPNRRQSHRVSFKGKDAEPEKEEREPPNSQRRIVDAMKRIRRKPSENSEIDNNDRTQFPCMK